MRLKDRLADWGLWSQVLAALIVAAIIGLLTLVGTELPLWGTWLTAEIRIDRLQIVWWSAAALVIGFALGWLLRWRTKPAPDTAATPARAVEENDAAPTDVAAASDAELLRIALGPPAPVIADLDETSQTVLKELARLDGRHLPTSMVLHKTSLSRLEAEHLLARLEQRKLIKFVKAEAGRDGQSWLTDSGRDFVVSQGWAKKVR